MTQFILKAIISGIMIALISEVGRRSTFLGALLASLPITSLLAFIWLYYETHDLKKISELSWSILYLVIPSLLLFILFPLFLKKLSFYPSLLLACLATVGCYHLTILIFRRFGILLCISLLLLPAILLAHEGHDHGPTPGETANVIGPITLTEESIRNLGIESVEVNLAPLQRSLAMPARIEALPEKNIQITPRFEGRILDILTKLGERVSVGQPLLKLDPTMIGNPPVILRAPLAGFVTRQNLTLGQTFTSQSVLMEVADYEKVLARGMTYESPDLSQIKIGQTARVKVDVFANEVFVGTLQRMDVGLERDTKTFEVFVLLDNPDLKLRANMQASLSLGLGEPQQVLAVPQRAILGDTGNYFVFVKNDATFEKRPVVLGIKAGDQVEVLEGVLPGERVVIQGNYQLQYATGIKKESDHQDASHVSGQNYGSFQLWIIVGLIMIIGALVFFIRYRK